MSLWTSVALILVGTNLASHHVTFVNSYPSDQPPLNYTNSLPPLLQLLRPILPPPSYLLDPLIHATSFKDGERNSSDYQTLLMNRWGAPLNSSSSSKAQVVLFESSLPQMFDDLGISTSKCTANCSSTPNLVSEERFLDSKDESTSTS